MWVRDHRWGRCDRVRGSASVQGDVAVDVARGTLFQLAYRSPRTPVHSRTIASWCTSISSAGCTCLLRPSAWPRGMTRKCGLSPGHHCLARYCPPDDHPCRRLEALVPRWRHGSDWNVPRHWVFFVSRRRRPVTLNTRSLMCLSRKPNPKPQLFLSKPAETDLQPKFWYRNNTSVDIILPFSIWCFVCVRVVQAFCHSGAAIWPTAFVTFRRRHWTLLSRTRSRRCSRWGKPTRTWSTLARTWCRVALLVQCLWCLCTRWTTAEHVLPMTPRLAKRWLTCCHSSYQLIQFSWPLPAELGLAKSPVVFLPAPVLIENIVDKCHRFLNGPDA